LSEKFSAEKEVHKIETMSSSTIWLPTPPALAAEFRLRTFHAW
jgi:hypothetical protein